MPNRSRRTFLAGMAGLAIVGASTAGAIVFNRTDDTASAQSPVVASTSPAPSAVQSTPGVRSSASSTNAAITEPSAAVAAPTSSAAPTTAEVGPTSAHAVSTSKASSSTDSVATSKTGSASTYRSGKYTQSGDYDSPGGGESITVTVTLTEDVVTATSATGSADGGPSSQYQEQFISGYAGEVVGKDIDSISLSRVSGSSLTSNGFNAALAKIKSEAKA